MKNSIIITGLFLLGILKLKAQENVIYHYSVIDAMRNGIYTGQETIKSLRAKGDFGLGTYNQLDGEMIALDGIYYRIAPDGKVIKAEANRQVPFAAITRFQTKTVITLSAVTNADELQTALRQKLPSVNRPYAVSIHLTFDEIIVGGAEKISAQDTTGLAQIMKTRPLYTKQHVTGTLVGFYNPTYMGGVDLSPFHFHFISDDKTYAGHLVSGKLSLKSISANVEEKAGYHITLPQKADRFDKSWIGSNGDPTSY